MSWGQKVKKQVTFRVHGANKQEAIVVGTGDEKLGTQ